MSRTSSASFAAPASASRRLSIGVEPECAAWPRGEPRGARRRTCRAPRPAAASCDSSTGPCSMCSSRYAAAFLAATRALERASRSMPCSPARPAARCRRDRASWRSSSWSRIEPAAARRAEQAAAEARAFFVGPIDQPHRHRRRALGGDAAQHLDARRARSGSRRASRRSAPNRCARRSAARARMRRAAWPTGCRPRRSDLDRQRSNLARARRALSPSVGERDALRAFGVAGERAQLFESLRCVRGRAARARLYNERPLW